MLLFEAKTRLLLKVIVTNTARLEKAYLADFLRFIDGSGSLSSNPHTLGKIWYSIVKKPSSNDYFVYLVNIIVTFN